MARVAEVAVLLRAAHAGESKASLREGLTFLRHLGRLRAGPAGQPAAAAAADARERVRQAVRFLAFGLVGVTGVVVNTAALWFFYHCWAGTTWSAPRWRRRSRPPGISSWWTA